MSVPPKKQDIIAEIVEKARFDGDQAKAKLKILKAQSAALPYVEGDAGDNDAKLSALIRATEDLIKAKETQVVEGRKRWHQARADEAGPALLTVWSARKQMRLNVDRHLRAAAEEIRQDNILAGRMRVLVHMLKAANRPGPLRDPLRLALERWRDTLTDPKRHDPFGTEGEIVVSAKYEQSEAAQVFDLLIAA